MYAHTHNTTPISNLKLSPYQIVFHTHPRIPLSFDLNLPRNSQQTCNSPYCSTLPTHSHYQFTDLNPFFSTLISKPISVWLLAVESAMLKLYSTVYKHLHYRLTSSTSTFEITHQKQLPLNTFVIRKNFKPVHFSTKLKPLRIGPYKRFRHFLTSHMNFSPNPGYQNHLFDKDIAPPSSPQSIINDNYLPNN